MSETKPKTILIVDDDVSVSEYLDVAIKSAGHETVLAFDGEQAMERFRKCKPDLVILDALIPKMDGFEVCRQIKKDPHGRRVPVVMMTGIYTKRSYRQQALNRSGAVEYIVKPLGISEIWRILQTHAGADTSAAEGMRKGELEQRVAGETGVASMLHGFFEHGDMKLGEGVSFSQVPLALTLRDLHDGRKTGLLFLRSEKRTSIFYIDRGQIVFVRSNDVELRLDRVLVKTKKITEAEYERAQELFKSHRGRRRMGEILTGIGVIAEKDLSEALRFQLQLLIARVFQWKEGTAYFVEGDLPNREEICVRVDTRAIIFTGVKNMRDSESIRRHLPGDQSVLARTVSNEAILDSVGLTAFERQILSVIDGTKTLRQVRSMGHLANVDIDSLLFAFLCTGLVKEDRVNSELLSAVKEEAEDEEEPRRRAFKGDLGTKPMPRILETLYRSRKTGVLTVQHQGVRKWLQIERGEVIFAGSDDPDDRIGRVLVRANLISEDDLESALKAASHRGGKRVGRVLVDSGNITLEELYWAVVFQVQRVVLSLFSWEKGNYLFREGPLPTRETITLELNTLNLIMEGVRSMPDDLVEDRLPTRAAVLHRREGWDDLAERIGLSAAETGILNAMSDGSTCGELLKSEIAPDPILHRALYAFSCIGLLDVQYPEGGLAGLAEEIEEEVAMVAGGAPAAAPRPAPTAAPPSNPPIPFPTTGPPAPVPPPREDDRQQVPRFLYDELLAERRELEDQILELHTENCDLEMQVRQAAAQVRDLLESPEGADAQNGLQELLKQLSPDSKPVD